MLGFLPVNTADAFLERINGKNIGASESKALLPPGIYTFSVDCQINAGPFMYMGSQKLTFPVAAGHIYKFSVEPGEKNGTCSTFAYDATGGIGPYPETVHFIPPYDRSDWKASGKAYAGHSIQDWFLNGEDDSHWDQMIEIEYWSRLMYPETADQRYHERVSNAEKQCPGTQLTQMSESTNDIIFELQNTRCVASKVRAQLSRFMTGKYGIYEVSYLSSNPVTQEEIAAWLKVLQNANFVLQR